MVKNISNGIPQIALELYIQFVEDGVTKMWPHLWWKIVKIHETSWNLQLGPIT